MCKHTKNIELNSTRWTMKRNWSDFPLCWVGVPSWFLPKVVSDSEILRHKTDLNWIQPFVLNKTPLISRWWGEIYSSEGAPNLGCGDILKQTQLCGEIIKWFWIQDYCQVGPELTSVDCAWSIAQIYLASPKQQMYAQPNNKCNLSKK